VVGAGIGLLILFLASSLAYESRNLYAPGSVNVPAPTSPCEALLVVGLRGNGDGVGPQSFEGQGGDTHGVVERLSPMLRAVPNRVVPFLYDTGPWHQVGGHMESGARAVVAWLDGRGHQCPNERWILIGQSEGAGVLHLSAPRLSQRVAAVVLLADPIRVAGAAYDAGVTTANGLLARPLLGPTAGAVRDDVPPVMAGRFWSYCLVDDPVCDTAPLDFVSGVVKKLAGSDVHTSYRNHPDVMERAARFAAAAAQPARAQ
jgi:hypothetical protein